MAAEVPEAERLGRGGWRLESARGLFSKLLLI